MDYPSSPKKPPGLMSACLNSLFTLVTRRSPSFQVTHHQQTLLCSGHCTHLTGPTFHHSGTIQIFLPCPMELTDLISRTPLSSNTSECFLLSVLLTVTPGSSSSEGPHPTYHNAGDEISILVPQTHVKTNSPP